MRKGAERLNDGLGHGSFVAGGGQSRVNVRMGVSCWDRGVGKRAERLSDGLGHASFVAGGRQSRVVNRHRGTVKQGWQV